MMTKEERDRDELELLQTAMRAARGLTQVADHAAGMAHSILWRAMLGDEEFDNLKKLIDQAAADHRQWRAANAAFYRRNSIVVSVDDTKEDE